MMIRFNNGREINISEVYRKLRKVLNFEVLLAAYLIGMLALGLYTDFFYQK